MVANDEAGTTAAVQHYLGELARAPGDSGADPIIRAMLARAVSRLHLLCAALLHQSYPRLTQAPLNLQAEELLSAVVERLLKALDKARPQDVRQFFALANQHMRWELNDLARRLDKNRPDVELLDSLAVAPESSGSELSQSARQILKAIEDLPECEREVFSLVRIQGMTQAEVAEVTGVSPKTVQRRLNRSLLLLTDALAGISPGEKAAEEK